MEILLANPRGFCAGVDRAIEIVKRALVSFGPPIYVRHEVVHNRYVVTDLRQKGAIFTDEVDEIPIGAIAIFSAHGVSQAVRAKAKERKLTIFDATCPLVTKVHMEVARYSRQEIECVLIGHAKHPEVEGTMGQYANAQGGIYLIEKEQDVAELIVKNPKKLAYVTQTTLSLTDTVKIIAALKNRFPEIMGPKREDICYATQNRQDAVKILAEQTDIVIVVGSPNSSNSNRLKELAERLNRPAYLIDSSEQLQKEWFLGKKTIGITAGASAPEILVQGVVERLCSWWHTEVKELYGQKEDMEFALPKQLRDVAIEDAR